MLASPLPRHIWQHQRWATFAKIAMELWMKYVTFRSLSILVLKIFPYPPRSSTWTTCHVVGAKVRLYSANQPFQPKLLPQRMKYSLRRWTFAFRHLLYKLLAFRLTSTTWRSQYTLPMKAFDIKDVHLQESNVTSVSDNWLWSST